MKNLSDNANKYGYLNKCGYFSISGTDKWLLVKC